MNKLTAIGVSGGIAIAKALVLKPQELNIPDTTIEDTEKESQKFNDALEKSKDQIRKLKENGNETLQEILDAHLMILDDPEFIPQIVSKITGEKSNAAKATQDTCSFFKEIFLNMDNEYMRQRASDVEDLGNRLISNILGIQMIDLGALDEETILVSEDITPSQTAQMNKDKVKGFVTEIGGKTSHSSIMARSMEIPAIAGMPEATDKIKSGDTLILDGDKGEVIVNPDADTLNDYEKQLKEQIEYKAKLKEYKEKKATSKDGHTVKIESNIGSNEDAARAIELGADGIGLFRTEFLYMHSEDFPSEEFQFQAYKDVLETMQGRPVIFRTLDIGGDKNLSYLQIPPEMNPFLGFRAIRLCMKNKEMFITQLRAILRASVYGQAKIMYPMISSVWEVREANKCYEEAKRQLDSENIPYSKDIKLGIMVEIPAAAVTSDLLAKEVDFFSIGTNDLIQYTCAVDRMNQNISHIYDPFNPAVLRLINTTIKNGHKENITVGMCGEAASNPNLIPLLLGMGLDEFSMTASAMLESKKLISTLDKKEMEKVVEKVLQLPTSQDIKDYMKSINLYK